VEPTASSGASCGAIQQARLWCSAECHHLRSYGLSLACCRAACLKPGTIQWSILLIFRNGTAPARAAHRGRLCRNAHPHPEYGIVSAMHGKCGPVRPGPRWVSSAQIFAEQVSEHESGRYAFPPRNPISPPTGDPGGEGPPSHSTNATEIDRSGVCRWSLNSGSTEFCDRESP